MSIKKSLKNRIISIAVAFVTALSSVFVIGIEATAFQFAGGDMYYGEENHIAFASARTFGLGGIYYVSPDGNLWVTFFYSNLDGNCFVQDTTSYPSAESIRSKYRLKDYSEITAKMAKEIGTDSTFGLEKPIKLATNVKSVYNHYNDGDLAPDRVYIIKNDNSLWRIDMGECTAYYQKNFSDVKPIPYKIMNNVATVNNWGWDGLSVITTKKELYKIDSKNGKRTARKVLDDVVQHSVSKYHHAAVTSDGTLYEWGEGLCADGKVRSTNTPQKTMTNVKSVYVYAYGLEHEGKDQYGGIAVKDSGKVVAWGTKPVATDDYLKSINSVINYGNTPVSVYKSGVKRVFLSDDSYAGCEAVLSPNGTLYMKGANHYNQIIGCKEKSTNKLYKQASDVREFLFGGESWAILKNDGTVWLHTRAGFGKVAEGVLPDTGDFKIINEYNLKLTWNGYSDAICYVIRGGGTTCESLDTTQYYKLKEGTYDFIVTVMGGKHHGEQIKITASTGNIN